jgi:penicillin-binding protein A
MEKRIRRLGVFMMLCFVALFVQLNNIQVLKAHSLSVDPGNPRIQIADRSQSRGDIISADGVTLASSSLAQAGADKYKRVYNPLTAALFAQIVGFDSPRYGKTGIEDQYNSYLQTHSRPAKTLSDLLVPRSTTDNVTLTIDSHLQLEVATALNNDIPTHPGVAAAVVIDPRSGAIKAMYSNPTYDPAGLVSTNDVVEQSTYNSLNPKRLSSPLLSHAYQFAYAPGSTFKTVTSSAVFDRDPALAKVDYPLATCIPLPQSNVPLCNYGHNGPTGPEKCGGVIQVTLPASCDTAFAQLGMALGAANLNGEAQGFGFNQRIPLDLPGVPLSAFPTVAALTDNSPSQAYSAFGQQNVDATDLQMALVVAGLANQGVIMTPHLMAEIRDSQGNLVASYAPKPWLKATSPQTAAAVTSLMQAVVSQPGATAYGVFPASENVAAKTGTAETGPNDTLTHDWMVAFAPADNPRVAVAVVVPDQPGNDTGASTSGPVTQAILAAALAEAS